MIGLLNSAKYNTIIILFLVNVKRLAYFLHHQSKTTHKSKYHVFKIRD